MRIVVIEAFDEPGALRTDRRFADYPDRRRNWGELVDELEEWSTELSTAECQAAFDREGVPSSPYRTVKQVLDDPQLAHRNALAEVRDASGAFRVINPPFRMSEAPTQVSDFAAGLGEHTREVLHEIGYANAEIDALIAEGVAAGVSIG